MAMGTREALMQNAERLMRTRGYMAFSYADLAETVGITKASIHHHFSTKEELGAVIVEGYISEVRGTLEKISEEHNEIDRRLDEYFGIFRSSIENGLLPLCGALAAELSALPPRLQQLTKGFFEMQLAWLVQVLDQGILRGEIPAGAGSRKKAFFLLSALEGASFVNWATKEEKNPLDENLMRLIIERG